MVDMEMQVALVPLVQSFVLVTLGQAWVLLLDVTVLGLRFLRGLRILVLHFLLGLECSLGSVSGLVVDFHRCC